MAIRNPKVGDKVQVVRKTGQDKLSPGFRVGSKGKVIQICAPILFRAYPVVVKNLRADRYGWFNGSELKRIR